MGNQDRVHLWSDGQTGVRAETKLLGLGSPADSPQGLSSPTKGLLTLHPAQGSLEAIIFPQGYFSSPSSTLAPTPLAQMQPQPLPSGHPGGSGSSAQGIWSPQSGGFSPLRHMEFWRAAPKRNAQVHVPGVLRKRRIFTFWARAMVARREADMEVGEDRHQGRPLGTQGERGERKAKTQ